MLRPIAIAAALCGTLDILFAMILTLSHGRQIGNMLRFVASGPFPAATEMGTTGAILGLVVHFALMAVLVTIFVLAARARPSLLDRPVLAGLAYGLLTYFVMNWLIVPLRFDAPLPLKPMQLATQLFAHIVLVGLPTAFIARRYLRS
jgi:uncharacterized membrane protein YagU involved in acid resistance